MSSSQLPAPPLVDAAANVGSLRTLGTGAQQAAAGNDSRFGAPSAAQTTPAPSKIPLSLGSGYIAPGWLAVLTSIGGSTLVENGSGGVAFRKLTLDDINPAFAISSFATSAGTIEIGDSISNPSFTASYNRTAASVTINDGSGALAVTLPGTSFAYNAGGLPSRTYTSNTINAGQNFTIVANEAGGPTKSTSVGFAYRPRGYWGKSTDPGSYNEAFAEGLPSNGLISGRQQTRSFNTTGAEYMFFAFPATFGGSSSNFIDTSTGFAAGFSKVGTVSVTAGTGGAPTNNYDIWRSDVSGLGSQTIAVT